MLAKLALSLLVIAVFCKEQIYLDLTEGEFHYVILPIENEIVAAWEILVLGNRSPILYSLFADNKEIDFDSSKYEYNITNENIFLKIRNISENILNTRFFLVATNLYGSKQLILTFNVTNLFSDGIKVHSLNETDSIIKCVVKSVLQPDINWLTCSGCDSDEITCLDTPIKKTKSERLGLQLTSYLHLNSSWSGCLKCVAENSIHSVQQSKEIAQVNGSMEIISYWISLVEIDKTTKIGQITPPKDVYLWCVASAVNHTNKIKWALNSIENDLEEDDERLGPVVNTVFGFWLELVVNVKLEEFPYVAFCKTWLKNGTMEYRQVQFTDEIRNNGTGYNVTNIVWSFGIVLWELFSLARTPYPAMEFNESFCERLLDGYRMKSPQFATQEIYEIMLHCWHAKPTMRPSFTELCQEIGLLLEETIREH